MTTALNKSRYAHFTRVMERDEVDYFTTGVDLAVATHALQCIYQTVPMNRSAVPFCGFVMRVCNAHPLLASAWLSLMDTF
jgi:hypothetical protein